MNQYYAILVETQSEKHLQDDTKPEAERNTFRRLARFVTLEPIVTRPQTDCH